MAPDDPLERQEADPLAAGIRALSIRHFHQCGVVAIATLFRPPVRVGIQPNCINPRPNVDIASGSPF
jgi:hypothetical protein